MNKRTVGGSLKRIQTESQTREMVKIDGFKYVLCLSSSIFLNLVFFLSLYFSSETKQLSWSKEAAAEAEAIASISCSGHGRTYLDGLTFEGKPKCDCNSCYGGADCSQFFPDCSADADSGDPIFLEPFWKEHAASSAIVVAGWHRMSYRYEDGSFISYELKRHIRQLHKAIGNAVTDGRYILFGAGSTQLINAALLALSPENSSSPASVVATNPFYPLYRSQADFFKSVAYEWQGDTLLWKNRSDSYGPLIEFVTSPNNPDGKLKKQVLNGSSVKHIFDHAYYWPHFSAIPAAADEDFMVFTLSKLTGHAGNRFGWALIKDEGVYKKMSSYLSLNTAGVSHDTQVRTLKLLKVVLETEGKEIFEFGYKTMKNKWEKLTKSLSSSKHFSLQNLEPQYCNYFQEEVGPSPAYAWIKCERKEDEDCSAVLASARIIGRGGSTYNADPHYVRLSLIKSEDDFDILLQKIDALVSNENSIAYI